MLKFLIDMDTRGNKLSSCKIPDHKKTKNFGLKEKKGNRKNSEYNSVVFTTLKRERKLKLSFSLM